MSGLIPFKGTIRSFKRNTPLVLKVSTHCMALVYPISQLYLCTELKILFLWTLLIVF